MMGRFVAQNRLLRPLRLISAQPGVNSVDLKGRAPALRAGGQLAPEPIPTPVSEGKVRPARLIVANLMPSRGSL
jgi:hypothetical protein